jgi:hypothetical protein
MSFTHHVLHPVGGNTVGCMDAVNPTMLGRLELLVDGSAVRSGNHLFSGIRTSNLLSALQEPGHEVEELRRSVTQGQCPHPDSTSKRLAG